MKIIEASVYFDTTYGAYVTNLNSDYWVTNATTTDGFNCAVNYNSGGGKWVIANNGLKGQTKTIKYAYFKIG